MKAITVVQPHAYAITVGAKRIENRSFATRHRGPLAIHAGKSKMEVAPSGLQELLADEKTVVPDSSTLAYGAIVAVVDCVRLEDLPAEFVGDPFAVGPFCWIFDNVRALATPIPCEGKLRVWEMPGDIAEALAIQAAT